MRTCPISDRRAAYVQESVYVVHQSEECVVSAGRTEVQY
jgi:hypothetical protein